LNPGQDDSALEISEGSLQYSVRILPLRDVSGAELGKIIALFDISEKKLAIKRLLLLQILGFAIVSVGLFVYFQIGFRRR